MSKYTKLFLIFRSVSLVSSRPLPSFRWSALNYFNSVYWNKHYVLLSTCKGNSGKFYFNICAFNIVFSLTTFKESNGKSHRQASIWKARSLFHIKILILKLKTVHAEWFLLNLFFTVKLFVGNYRFKRSASNTSEVLHLVEEDVTVPCLLLSQKFQIQ
jgi:hypothetical protein